VNEFLAAEGMSLAYLAGLVVFSAFFSGSETALFSLGRDELDELEHRHPRRGAAARRLIAKPDALLVSILFGNLVVNTLYFSIAAIMTDRAITLRGSTVGAGVSVVALLVLILFGEILPKAIAGASPKTGSSVASLPLLAFHLAVGRPAAVFASPVLAAVRWIAKHREVENLDPEELRMLVELAGSSGALSVQEAEMIDGVVALSDVRVREVMVPRVDVVFASIDDRPEQVLRRLKAPVRSRAPVFEGPTDNIVGVVETRQLVAACVVPDAGHTNLRPFMRPVVFVPESARVANLLDMVRDTNLEVAVVVDEYGGTAGLVTLEDLAEAVFGDIVVEESEQEAPVERVSEGVYVLPGDVSVRDWEEAFDVESEEGQFDTLGGFVTYLLKRIPKVGDEVVWHNLKFVVRGMRRRRVTRVELSLAPPAVGEKADR
jgi:putative hemolysin